MRRAVVALTCLLLALPAAARAQQLALAVGAPGSATHLKFKSLVVRVAGQVSVSFHSDAGTGCAALAACVYGGSLAWTPNGGGILELTQYEQRHRTHVDAFLGFGENGPGSLTASTVRRSSGGQCADEATGLSFLPATEHGGKQTFRLDSALLPTRCAGPVPTDLAAALPPVTVSSRRLEAGHVRLDFHSRRSFAAHGFAGTLTSTLVVTVGGPEPAGPAIPVTQPQAPGSKLTRIVTETLHPTVTGSLTAAVAGSSNSDVCVLLDTCGLTGTLTLTPRPALRQAELIATGPANRPYRDFLTALGLSRAGRAAGISVTGAIQWRDAGTVTEVIDQAARCSDAARLSGGFVNLAITRHRIGAQYGLGGGGAARTRCPGPVSIGANGPVAAGSVPRSRLQQRTFTITLHGSGPGGDDGYTLRPGGAITLRLRRGRVRQSVERVPTLVF